MCQCPLNQQVVNEVWSAEWLEKTLTSFNVPGEMEWTVLFIFHSPFKPNHTDNIPVVSQREVECGSTQCGKNTSDNLKQFGNLKAVMLDNHGPNIVFNQNIDPQEVIDFIERNFVLTQKTGGYNLR